MRAIAKDTHTAFVRAGVDDAVARDAAAEVGEVYVALEATKERVGILTTIVITGFVLVIGILVQIALRIGAVAWPTQP